MTDDPFEEEQGETEEPVGQKDSRPPAYFTAANRLVAEDHYRQDRAGNYYFWNGRHWDQVTGHSMRARLWRVLNDMNVKATRSNVVGDALSNLAWRAHMEDFEFKVLGPSEVALNNGVLDVMTGDMRDHDPEDYLENVIPVDYSPDAVCPRFREALEQWFKEPSGRWRDRVAALQEFFGYVLLPEANLKKALLLYGEGDTGKSAVLAILREMVGRQYCCNLGMDEMSDPRMRSVIKGKRLNAITELSAKGLVDESGFKALVAADAVLLDAKNKAHETYVSRAKHTIACNPPLPRLPGRTQEVFNRLLIIQMQNPIYEPELDFHQKMLDELPGIVNWAIGGAARLVENDGVFTHLWDRQEVLDEWAAEQSPFVDWFRENFCRAPEERIPLEKVANLFATHSGERFSPRSAGHQLRHVLSLGNCIKKCRPKSEDPKAPRLAPVACLVGWAEVKPTSRHLTSSDLVVEKEED